VYTDGKMLLPLPDPILDLDPVARAWGRLGRLAVEYNWTPMESLQSVVSKLKMPWCASSRIRRRIVHELRDGITWCGRPPAKRVRQRSFPDIEL